tara:strand:+ start:338 stop:712 length:375 start_codon:yes stop_codon:yes gene_type:complete
MNKLYQFLLVASIVLTSCEADIEAKFEITNHTNTTIDSINIKSFDHSPNENFITLEAGESKVYWLNMSNLPKVDGDYLLSYKQNKNSSKIKRFGYYTNGYPTEKLTEIEILGDSIIINPILDNY